MIPIRRQSLPINYTLLKKLFPCDCMPLEKRIRLWNGCLVTYSMCQWSKDKKHAKFCFPDKNGSLFFIGLLPAVKNRFFADLLWHLKWVDPGQRSASSLRINRFGRNSRQWESWDQRGIVYYKLLKPGETVTAQY